MFEEGFVVAIEAHVAVAMVDNDQVAEAAQPVRENDASIGDGVDFLPRGGTDEQATPWCPAVLTWTAETSREFPADR